MMKKFLALILACCFLAGTVAFTEAEQTPVIVEIPEVPAKLLPASEVLDIPADDLGIAGYHDFQYDGANRTYLMYVPEYMAKNAPLVFVLHGYYGFASSFMNETGINAIADKYGFGVVYPQGMITNASGFACTHWNADFTFTDTDDVGFLTSLAKYLQESLGFSGKNTFIAGLSNGGFMCYTLAVNAPGAFRAIASVAGTMSRKTWDNRENALATPVLQIHGSADTVVPIDGSMTPEGGWGGAPDMTEIIRFWATKNGTDRVVTSQNGNITLNQYTSATDEVLVSYCLIDGFGHAWPTVGNTGLDVNEVIWGFFMSFVED
jgi:polyhydroxybutyrate depolymerase